MGWIVRRKHRVGSKCLPGSSAISVCGLMFVLLVVLAAPHEARGKGGLPYGEGLIVNVPLPIAEVTQAVADVADNGIIRGTKEYNKDEYVSHAESATSTPLFPAWTDPGKVFYKVRKQVLAPWNFKDSTDIGTLAVRYVVQPQGEKNTVLRIDALFVEDDRHSVHKSSGSVESSEYKDIQDHLDATELVKKETAEALQAKEERMAKKDFEFATNTEVLSTPPTSGESSSRPDVPAVASPLSPDTRTTSVADSNETPEQHLAGLRQQVQRVVKKPGAPLKSAPFHSAATLKLLNPGTEVLVVILTPYWLGVETHEGEHGWIRRDQAELMP